jgi:hypothetical protein
MRLSASSRDFESARARGSSALPGLRAPPARSVPTALAYPSQWRAADAHETPARPHRCGTRRRPRQTTSALRRRSAPRVRVNSSTPPRCPHRASRSPAVTRPHAAVRLPRRQPLAMRAVTMPAATVALVSGSMRMNQRPGGAIVAIEIDGDGPQQIAATRRRCRSCAACAPARAGTRSGPRGDRPRKQTGTVWLVCFSR